MRWVDKLANKVLARLPGVTDVDLAIGDGGTGDMTHMPGVRAPTLAIRAALVRAAGRVNAVPDRPPPVSVHVVSEFRGTKQPSVHKKRMDMKSKKGLVRYKDGTVSRGCGAARRDARALAVCVLTAASQSRVTWQGRIKLCVCGHHPAMKRTGGVLYKHRDVDGCLSVLAFLKYGAKHHGRRHPAYRPLVRCVRACVRAPGVTSTACVGCDASSCP